MNKKRLNRNEKKTIPNYININKLGLLLKKVSTSNVIALIALFISIFAYNINRNQYNQSLPNIEIDINKDEEFKITETDSIVVIFSSRIIIENSGGKDLTLVGIEPANYNWIGFFTERELILARRLNYSIRIANEDLSDLNLLDSLSSIRLDGVRTIDGTKNIIINEKIPVGEIMIKHIYIRITLHKDVVNEISGFQFSPKLLFTNGLEHSLNAEILNKSNEVVHIAGKFIDVESKVPVGGCQISISNNALKLFDENQEDFVFRTHNNEDGSFYFSVPLNPKLTYYMYIKCVDGGGMIRTVLPIENRKNNYIDLGDFPVITSWPNTIGFYSDF